MEQDNCCVVCGEIIPEGIMVCRCCENKFLNSQLKRKEELGKRTGKKVYILLLDLKKFFTNL